MLWSVSVWVAVTEIEKVQDAPALMEPPLSEIVCDAGAAVITPVDPHVPFSLLGSSTARPAGSVSVKAIADSVSLVLGVGDGERQGGRCAVAQPDEAERECAGDARRPSGQRRRCSSQTQRGYASHPMAKRDEFPLNVPPATIGCSTKMQ